MIKNQRVKVGKLPELELAAVEAEVAARKSALIDVQSRHEQARLRFLYLLNPGKEMTWSQQLQPTDKPFLPNDTLASVTAHEQIGLITVYCCSWTFFITLGKTTYAKSFQKAYPNLNSPHYQASAGLSFEFPTMNRKASAQYTRARQQIEATRMTRELQEKKLAAELEKFRVGKSTNILVLQAQRDFTSSQLVEARTMVAYLNALVSLYLSEGALLERRGIETFQE